MNCPQETSDLLLYAAEQLSAEEAASIASHLETGCEACRQTYDHALATWAAIGVAAAPRPASTAVKERLIGRIEGEQDEPPPREAARRQGTAPPLVLRRDGVAKFINRLRTPTRRALAYAAAVAFGVLISYAFLGGGSPGQADKLARLERQLARVKAQQDAASNSVAAQVMNWLASPAAQVVSLKGNKKHTDYNGRLIWHPEKNAAQFFAPALVAGKQDRRFTLWLVGPDGRRRSAGRFKLNGDGVATIKLDVLKGETTGPYKQVEVREDAPAPRDGEEPATQPLLLAGQLPG